MYKIHSSTKETLYPPAVIQMFVGFTAHFLTLPHRSSQTDVYLWICLILFYPVHPKTEPLTYTLVPTIPAPSRIPPGAPSYAAQRGSQEEPGVPKGFKPASKGDFEPRDELTGLRFSAFSEAPKDP